MDPSDRPEATALVEFALQYVGYDYIWGGKDPATGFDCSGFVWYVYTHNGYADIGRTATDQWEYKASWEVSQDSLLPGDLLFFSESYSLNDITHVGIYIGDGEFVHAANSPGRRHHLRRGQQLLRRTLRRRPPDHSLTPTSSTSQAPVHCSGNPAQCTGFFFSDARFGVFS